MTKRQVNQLCMEAEQGWEAFTLEEVQLLVAEVRALRVDLECKRAANAAFRATLARVEATVEGYEAFVHAAAGVESKVVSAYETVIEELRAALRGEL